MHQIPSSICPLVSSLPPLLFLVTVHNHHILSVREASGKMLIYSLRFVVAYLLMNKRHLVKTLAFLLPGSKWIERFHISVSVFCTRIRVLACLATWPPATAATFTRWQFFSIRYLSFTAAAVLPKNMPKTFISTKEKVWFRFSAVKSGKPPFSVAVTENPSMRQALKAQQELIKLTQNCKKKSINTLNIFQFDSLYSNIYLSNCITVMSDFISHVYD